MFELFRATLPVNTGEIDSELSECACEHIEEIFVLRENNRFGARIVLTNPENLPSQSVNLCAKRPIEVDVLDLAQRGIADIGIDRRRLAILREFCALNSMLLFLNSEALGLVPEYRQYEAPQLNKGIRQLRYRVQVIAIEVLLADRT